MCYLDSIFGLACSQKEHWTHAREIQLHMNYLDKTHLLVINKTSLADMKQTEGYIYIWQISVGVGVMLDKWTFTTRYKPLYTQVQRAASLRPPAGCLTWRCSYSCFERGPS